MKTYEEFDAEVNQVYAQATDYGAVIQKLIPLANDGNANALAYYVLADKLGLAEAKYQLGVTCEFGRCGVGQSHEVAAKIYQEAADLGHSNAQCQLGGLYERGKGVEKKSSACVSLLQACLG